MPCEFSNVYNSCYCLIGYELPLMTVADVNISEYPVTVLNVNEVALGVANNPSEYAFIWNTDADNRAIGKLFVGGGAYCFFLQKEADVEPPSNVLGALIAPPVTDGFFYGSTDLDTTGDLQPEADYIESVDDVFELGNELAETFTPGGNITVADFENGPDKELFIQVPIAEEPFTKWSEVGNPFQQNLPIDAAYESGSNIWFRTTRAGETLYLTRYQTTFAGAIVLSR